MIRRIGSGVALVALVGVLASCSSSGHKSSPTTTVRPAATSTSVGAATTSTTAAVSTTSAAPPVTSSTPATTPAPDGETAARRFFAAWLGHDITALDMNGAAPAVSAATAEYSKTSGAAWVFSNCQGAAGSTYCTWVRAAEDVVVQGDNVSTPHRAVGFQWHALDATGISEQVLNAWQTGSTAALQALATSGAVSQLQALQSHRSDGWQAPSSCQGTAGSFYCTFTAGSHHLNIQVGDVQMPHQVIGVTYG